MQADSLSNRGRKQLGKPLREDLCFFDEIQADCYHEQNTEGYIGLYIAENVLGWPKLREKLSEIPPLHEIDDWGFKYTQVTGSFEFRSALSNFFQKQIAKIPLNQDCIAVSSGATGILELLSWTLGDPGEVVGIVAPAYPVYTKDIAIKSELERYNISSNRVQEFKTGINPLHIDDLQKAKETIEPQGKNLKIIILTQPNNPNGSIYTKQQLEQFSKWSMDNKIHLVVNEIYIFSSIDINHPDIKEDYHKNDFLTPFQSYLPFVETEKSAYLHWIYSFSKDFGISGFRVGVLYSRNESLLDAFEVVGCPHQVSNQTQWTLMKLVEDDKWVSSYVDYIKNRLTLSYILVTNMFKELNISYYSARGTLFVWFNVSSFLSEDSFEAQNELWLRIYRETKCLLTGPGEFGNSKPGWLRMVITCVETEELQEAISRLKKWFLQNNKDRQ